MNADSTRLPRVGILGGGQLAMMMAQAYQQLGGEASVMSDTPDCPATAVVDQYTIGDYHDIEKLTAFFNKVDVVTLENEFVSSSLLIQATQESGTKVFPEPQRYQKIEDKLSENLFFKDLDIPIADFLVIHRESDLIDSPGFLKLAKGGYDGVGTYHVKNYEQAIDVFRRISPSGTVIFEHEVAFTKELSLVAAASRDETVFYPLVETHQDAGTCRYVSYPSGVSGEIETKAKSMVRKIMRALGTQGLFAFEFFLTKDKQLIINESAPRPHNSGHITIDTMNCSQFENHMRAVVNLPLTRPESLREEAVMVNLLGTRTGEFDPQRVLSQIDSSNMNIKFYGKRESRVMRKMGHINLWGSNVWARARKLSRDLEI